MSDKETNGAGTEWAIDSNWVGGVAPQDGVDTGTVKTGHIMDTVPAGATCLLIESGGTVAINYGTVTTNSGILTFSVGTVGDNYGVIAYNMGAVTNNLNTITYDATAMQAAVTTDLAKIMADATAIEAAFGVTAGLALSKVIISAGGTIPLDAVTSAHGGSLTNTDLMIGVTSDGMTPTGKIPLSYLVTEAGTYVNPDA